LHRNASKLIKIGKKTGAKRTKPAPAGTALGKSLNDLMRSVGTFICFTLSLPSFNFSLSVLFKKPEKVLGSNCWVNAAKSLRALYPGCLLAQQVPDEQAVAAVVAALLTANAAVE